MKFFTIKGYDDSYSISKDAQIFSNKSNKILKIRLNKRGYKDVCFCINGVKKNIFVHRIMAEAFIPNPNLYPCVNHINGIKTDNRIENLEWATHAHNNKHAWDNGLNKKSYPCLGKFGGNHPGHKKIMAYSENQDIIIFDGLLFASRCTGIQSSHISSCCNGKRNTAGIYDVVTKEWVIQNGNKALPLNCIRVKWRFI